jgi:hypothetical protein
MALKPDSAQLWNNYGLILHKANRRVEALEAVQKAIVLDANYAHAFNNRGLFLWKQGKFEEAHQSLAEAIRLQPDYAFARLNRAQVWLQQGDFERGWLEYEARLKHPLFRLPGPPGIPIWDGSNPVGKTILLRAEQGFGDTLQFIRFAILVKRMGARVVLECQKALFQLLQSYVGVDELIARGSPLPPVDLYAPLMSLPYLLRTTIDAIPQEIPYLFADRESIARWRSEFPKDGQFRIGIVWQGNPNFSDDAFRSIPLMKFLGLTRLPGVRLYALQKGPGRDQLTEKRVSDALVDLGPRLDENTGAFIDTAAVMCVLDLIISIDSACAHLAGALGVPIWLPAYYVSDWRWLNDREDSPWYPTLRLFRQPRMGDWDSVIESMAERIRSMIEDGRMQGGS